MLRTAAAIDDDDDGKKKQQLKKLTLKKICFSFVLFNNHLK